MFAEAYRFDPPDAVPEGLDVELLKRIMKTVPAKIDKKTTMHRLPMPL